MKPTTKNVLYMLKESNAIEDVWDRYSLINAHRAWKYTQKQKTLSNNVIKETHRILMRGQPLEPKHKGDWRDIPVTIGGQYKGQPKIVIDSLMQDFCTHVNHVMKTNSKNHDAIHCHLMFENIHPFVDGNGRLGRILLNWQLTKMDMPLLVYIEADKKTYYRLFASYRAAEMDIIYKQIFEGRWKFDI